MDRLKLAAGIVLGLLLGSPAEAKYTATAVNLPASTPDAVRDQVARSLASTRDRVGWALHPFRGEFHGLGAIDGLASFTTDLSGNGRVIVGRDLIDTSTIKAFIWSPATGKVYYDMRPSGASGSAIPTTISADGVYVGGQATSGPTFSSSRTTGFLWSLAGSQSLASTAGRNYEVSALSADGRVIVGLEQQRYESNSGTSFFGPDPRFLGDIDYYIPAQYSFPSRQIRGRGLQGVDLLLNSENDYYTTNQGFDVSADGSTVLLNGERKAFPTGVEPILWRANGSIRGLGGPSVSLNWQDTFGLAISADGSTVVGYSSEQGGFGPATFIGNWSANGDDPFVFTSYPSYRPVLWREETGWIDLGELKSNANLLLDNYEATGVSADGSVVIGRAGSGGISDCGSYYGCYSSFHWDEQRGMRDLFDVLSLDYGLDLAGWSLGPATAISDDGTTIIGGGRRAIAPQ